MGRDILFALWFFLPAGIANITPILVAKTPVINRWGPPIDLGLHWRGKRLLGDHKTWRGIISGFIAGTLTVWLQVWLYKNTEWAQTISQPIDYSSISILGLGFALSIGALGGDAIKSILKRQLSVKPGESWFPFDQLDYIIGGLLLSSFVVILPFQEYIWIFILWFGLHLLFSYIGYITKFKEHPI